jgi:hypothetical protein
MSKFKYYLEEGCEFVDTKFSTYNKGTQLMLEILDEQDCEYESTVQYESLVDDLEACRDQDDVEEVMNEMGTDYIDELEVHIAWMDLMFPRVNKSPYLTYIGDEVVS